VEFELTYTPEQQEFRKEVRAWLEENGKMPAELGKWPLNDRDLTREQFEWKKGLRQKIGHKGWLYPQLPTNVGGGGLSLDMDIIIKEELAPYQPINASGVAVAGLYVWGSEQQKQNLLRPLLQGDKAHWLLWTEPDCGVDLAAVKTRAVRDGDDYVINGVKCYISGSFEPDYMWLLAVTDPDAPRHANLGHFYMPANLPGITMQYQDLINRGTQHFVWFEDVRVPREYLIGGETQGWQVAQTALELEHGAEGSLEGRNNVARGLVRKMAQGKVHTASHGDAASEHLVDALIRSDVNRLISRRNFWMFRQKEPMSYHGSQNLWFGRETRIRTSEDLLDLLGPHALMDDEKWGLMEGEVEHTVRNGSMATHAAGSYEIDKVIMARRIGMSRTKETMAPTH